MLPFHQFGELGQSFTQHPERLVAGKRRAARLDGLDDAGDAPGDGIFAQG